MIQSFNEEKLKLIEIIEFFYDNYKDQPLTFFDTIFKEFDKLKAKKIDK